MSVNSKMTAIADAIRAKTGGTELLTLDAMAQDIAAIDTSENLDEVLTEQESLIDQIQAALEDKGVKPEQTKTATPSLSQQTIVPDSGKTLSGVTVEPITSTLLTSLDTDFVADNIAEGVDLFGLVGSHAGGIKMATGTVTATSGSTGSGIDRIYYSRVVVTGLSFAPADVMLFRAYGTGSRTAQSVRGTTVYYYSDGANTTTCTRTLTSDGFSIQKQGSSTILNGNLDGSYIWIAWTE